MMISKYVNISTLISIPAILLMLIFVDYKHLTITPMLSFYLAIPILLLYPFFNEIKSLLSGEKNTGRILEPAIYWSPIAIFALIYENLTFMTKNYNLPLIDNVLYNIDVSIFGQTPSKFFEFMINPNLTYLFVFLYMAFYLLPPVILAAAFYNKSDKTDFSNFISALVLAMGIGYIMYLMFPAVGPEIAYHNIYSAPVYPDNDVARFATQDIQMYDKNAFPSLHTAISMIYLLFSRRMGGKFFAIYALMAIILWFSILYLRQHYFIDMAVGAVLAFFAYFASINGNKFIWKMDLKKS